MILLIFLHSRWHFPNTHHFLGLPAVGVGPHEIGDLTHIERQREEHRRELGGGKIGGSDEWTVDCWDDDDGGWVGVDSLDNSEAADADGRVRSCHYVSVMIGWQSQLSL